MSNTELRAAAQQALECLEQLQGGCTDSEDGTVEAITVWCPEIITALRAALAQPAAPDSWNEGFKHGQWLAKHAAPVAPAEPANPWRQAVDEALIASCLDCTSDGEEPMQALARLIQWERTIALDPAISSAAAVLVQRGRDEAAEPASEPVAPDDPHAFSRRCAAAEFERGPWGKYARPQPAPAREPLTPWIQRQVPLTDSQIDAVLNAAGLHEPTEVLIDREIARAIERAHGITPAKEAPHG